MSIEVYLERRFFTTTSCGNCEFEYVVLDAIKQVNRDLYDYDLSEIDEALIEGDSIKLITYERDEIIIQ
mgnify:CR=1 FL=1|jgi:hypothetical protein|tara:strand:+ start:141 stop:347 length:207 start_codon:yes stop_codon:yes gene_type:complete